MTDIVDIQGGGRSLNKWTTIAVENGDDHIKTPIRGIINPKTRPNKHEKSSRSSRGVSEKCVTTRHADRQTHKQDQVKSSSGTKN